MTKSITLTATPTLQLKGLGRRKLAAVAEKAKRLRIAPQRYLRQLVEADLALDRKAQTTSLADLLGPGRAVDEDELDQLVEQARTRHFHRRRA